MEQLENVVNRRIDGGDDLKKFMSQADKYDLEYSKSHTTTF